MVRLIATLTIGLWLAVVGATTGVAVLLARVVDAIDHVVAEPDWWDDFESQFADYVESRG